ncbi:histidine kinase [Nostocales cyanobacterium HT-58-2]|nr:histidine kinase [Nostocales cyanobacterium HT-58-2]
MNETVKALDTPNSQQGTLPLLNRISANLPGMIFQFLKQQDGAQFIIYASSGCRELFELEPELLQADFQVLNQLIHPQDVKAFEESIATSCATGEPWLWEGRIMTPSGKLKWIQGTSRPEQQPSGDMIWDGLLIDITDRKLAEEKLRESEARYKAILDAIPDLMFRISRDGKYLDFKGEGANVTIPRNEIVGKNLEDLLPQDVALKSQKAITKTLDLKTLQTCEYQLPTPLGIRDYEARLVVSGQDEVLAIVRDITERKQTEITLRNLAQKFAKVFRSSPNPISISTLAEGRYIEVNDSFVEQSGYDPQEAIGRTAFDLDIWVNQSDRTSILQELQKHGVVRNMEFEFRRKSGEIRTGLFSAEVIHLDGIPCLLAVNHDITERKQAEELLRLSSKRDRLLAQTLSRIRQSLNLEQILQTTVDEVRQFLQTDRVFIALNDTKAQCRILAESVASKYPSVLNWQGKDKTLLEELKTLLRSNEVRIVEDTTKISVSPKLKALHKQFQTRANLAVPIMQGKELYGALIAHQCSGPRHWTPVEIDLLLQMSEQVAIAIQQGQLYQELEQLNANLERQVEERTAQLQQKMLELQELNRVKDVVLHTVSHELRTSVIGNLMVLNNLLNHRQGEAGSCEQGSSKQGAGEVFSPSSSPSSIPVSRSIIERMIQGNDRQLQMIESLLELHSSEAHGIVLHREVVCFSTLVGTILKDLEPMLTQHQVTVKNLVPKDLPLVIADPAQLQKVFVNLLTYSWLNNPPGVKFTLKARVETGIIRLHIQDDGVGISKLESDRLFDLYVREPQACCSTKIGLKMYLCRQIIQAHGGEIGVISNRKRGLTFYFTLPLATPS